MLVLVDIQDKKADRFMELIKNNSDAKVKPIQAPDAELVAEIKEIKIGPFPYSSVSTFRALIAYLAFFEIIG